VGEGKHPRGERQAALGAGLRELPQRVVNRRTGLVVEPRTDSVAGAVRFLREHPDDARSWGRAGKGVAEQVTWDHAIDRLLS